MVALIFPGQGSQYAGMGKALADNFPVARQTFEEADDALQFKISSLCFQGPEEELKLTANTQPAILTTSVAAYRVLESEMSLQPSYLAGHSLGEYSALVASGALAFADAVKTVRARGLFMQEAVPVGTGSMAAILGLEGRDLEEICREAAQGDVVAPANYNSPGQVVIAGHVQAVDRAIALAKEKGAKKAMSLPVSAPFHCSLMIPAGLRLKEVLDGVNVSTMNMPVVSNVEALPNQDHSLIRDLLVRQVSAPVRWDESILKMVDLGVEHFIEVGPGKVLSGLVRRIAKGVPVGNLEDTDSLKNLQANF
ncbi:ACP S-malonyltransferase [Desulfuromonas sp. AOP6]|uniref:ACP S-malonyltransferase n=1 Tax=Desulfuromonas sp. AOP6 TaxID=1566351 RepID=UPI001284EABF|nr:ACP S-malonyltransferase [Desulfuromonas sp. AOP6]BCA79816.1 malonyl CoA-acyl carrier protein transacylase [Desulfuromonas sp. AOP6]